MNTKTGKLLAAIHARGLRTSVVDGKLRVRGPDDRFTPKLDHLIRDHKLDLISLLTPEDRPSLTPINGKGSRVDPHSLLTDGLSVSFGADRESFEIWNGEQLAGKWIGIDTETHAIEDPKIPRLVLGSVSDGRQHFVIARDRIADFLQLHHDRSFVAHSMRFDFWVLADWLASDAGILWEIADAGRLHCTDVMEQLILLAKFDDHPRSRSLDDLAKYYLKVELFGKDDPRRTGFSEIDGRPFDDVDEWYLQYAVQDAIAAAQIHAKQRKIARQLQPDAKDLLPDARKKYGWLTEKLQVKAGIALDQIYRIGMHLDPQKVITARKALREELFDLAAELEQASPDVPLLVRYKQQRCVTDANRGFRLTDSGYPKKSDDAIREVLSKVAKKHRIKPPKSDTGKLSLTKDFWDDHRELSPVIDLFLDLQAKGKLFSFFVSLDGDHIHPRYVPLVRSGRVSCREPNLQQMPRAGSVREAFVASPGHVLIAIDFKALELATLSAVCLQKYGKSKLAEVINSGKDAHAYSYCKIHGMSEREFTKWKDRDPKAAKAARDAVKGVTFGVPGSMQPEGLTRYVKKAYGQEITLETATEYRDKLIREVYPEWKQYLAQIGSRVSTLTGRVRGRIERSGQLFNTQFQGIAGDGTKACLWELLRAGYRLVGFIHDEFLIELPEADDYSEQAETINKICCETMEEFTPGVTISCEYAVSRCWSKQAEEVRDDQGRLIAWEPAVVKTEPKTKVAKPPVTEAIEASSYCLDDPSIRVFVGDCRQVLPSLDIAPSLVFADPPFNIGEAYGEWNDRLPWGQYVAFTYEWIDVCLEKLSPDGSIFINVPDEIAAEIVMHLKGAGLELINWCCWHYRFGQCRNSNFIRSKEHGLYFARHRKSRTYNADAILVDSDRATKYGDNRTKHTKTPGKRVPFDVFGVPSDGQYWGRVQGNNAERRPHHENQLPELYLARVIKAISNPGDLILDPFCGSGTTATVARALGRRCITIEYDASNAASAFERIKQGVVREL